MSESCFRAVGRAIIHKMETIHPEVRVHKKAAGRRQFLRLAALTVGGFGGYRLAEWIRSQQPHEQREVDVVNPNMRVISVTHNLSFYGNDKRCDGYGVHVELTDKATSEIKSLEVAYYDEHMIPIEGQRSQYFIPHSTLEGMRDERNKRLSQNPDEHTRWETDWLKEQGVDPTNVDFFTYVVSQKPANLILEVRAFAEDFDPEKLSRGEPRQELGAYYFKKLFPVTCAPTNSGD